MHIVFYSTSIVFKAEELLTGADIKCKVVPTPVQDKAYCGVCIEVNDLRAEAVLSGIEHVSIE